MGTGQLFAGNLANLLIAILAFLQIIPWPIAGFLIIGIIILVTLSSLRAVARTGEVLEHETTIGTSLREVSRVEGPASPARRSAGDRTQPEGSSFKQHVLKPSIEPSPEKEKPEIRPKDSATTIEEGDYLSFEVEMEKGEEIVGDVSSSGEVNAYILNDENLTALDLDQEFWYEAGSEGVRNATLHFTAPDDGVWFFVVENAETKEITATAKVNLNQPSHPVPLLKEHGLELPDARLEGKL